MWNMLNNISTGGVRNVEIFPLEMVETDFPSLNVNNMVHFYHFYYVCVYLSLKTIQSRVFLTYYLRIKENNKIIM